MRFTRSILSAFTLYLLYSGASSLFLSTIFTVNLIYQIEIAKLNPLQLVLVGTVLETTCFVCQIPTGILADTYSRRMAVVIGVLAIGAGFMLEGSFPNFAVILFAQILWGFGATCTDGAEQAWITDEIGEEKVGQAFIRATQVSQVGGFVGTLASVGLASVRLNLPIVLGGAFMILLGASLLFFMPENGFRQAQQGQQESWRTMAQTFRSGLHIVRMRTVILIVVCIELIYGLSSEGWDRLSTAHLLTNFTFPVLGNLKFVVWFAIFSIIGSLLSLATTELVRRRVSMTNQWQMVAVLFASNVLLIAAVLTFAFAGNFFVAVAAFLGYGVVQSSVKPVWTTWLAQNIDAKVRATVFSMVGQMNAFGQIVGGPPVGYIGTVFSLRAAMVSVSILLSPVLLLYAYALRKVGKKLTAL